MASNHSSSGDDRPASPDSSDARRNDVPEGFGFIARDQAIEDIEVEAQPVQENPEQPAAVNIHRPAAQDIEGLFYGSPLPHSSGLCHDPRSPELLLMRPLS